MALTGDFKNTVKARAGRDPDFRVGLLQEAIEAFLSTDLGTGKILLRDYVKATLGLLAALHSRLARATAAPAAEAPPPTHLDRQRQTLRLGAEPLPERRLAQTFHLGCHIDAYD